MLQLFAAFAAYSCELVVHLKHRNAAALESAFWSIATPGDAQYLHFRSVEQLAAEFGASRKSLEATTSWLTSDLGASPSALRVSPMKNTIAVTVPSPLTADDAAWTLSAAGLAIPRVPEALSAAIDFIVRRDGTAAASSAAPHRVRRAGAPNVGYTIAQQKAAYGIPVGLTSTNPATLQMVWGPGTFGYSKVQLYEHKVTECPLLNMSRISFDTAAHGTPGGDNFGEGNLDVSMVTSFGLNVHTIVSNTNTSSSTEEGSGFGLALLEFVTDLAARPTVPQVLSISLGSLSAFSCDLLCKEVVKTGIAAATCKAFLQNQRQVCMYLSEAQNVRINDAFKLLGTRGVSVFGSSGDGGSHWSFGSFPSSTPVGRALNKVGCEYQFPVFPTTSPYVTSVGGTQWADSIGKKPMAWNGGQGGGGFSWTFPAPPHQAGGVKAYFATHGLPATSSFNASGRAYPDISCVSTDGTSQSSPSMAGIFR